MKIFVNYSIIILLLFNGIGALYGGTNFILHPNGDSMGMSVNWLTHTPFKDYLVPGIVLVIVNGLFSILILFAFLFKYKSSSLLVILQGLILFTWIFIQVFLLRTVHFLHIALAATGLALIILGMIKSYRFDTRN